ncbi:MAG: redoxin domain-containing protein, partial [Bacillota bacterium]
MGCSSYRNMNNVTRIVSQNAAAAAEAETCAIPGLGDPAPEFTANTTQGVRSLSEYRGRWLIFFSHPGDFT